MGSYQTSKIKTLFVHYWVSPSPVYGWTGLPQALLFYLWRRHLLLTQNTLKYWQCSEVSDRSSNILNKDPTSSYYRKPITHWTKPLKHLPKYKVSAAFVVVVTRRNWWVVITSAAMNLWEEQYHLNDCNSRLHRLYVDLQHAVVWYLNRGFYGMCAMVYNCI